MKEGAYRPQHNQPEQPQPLQGNAEGRRSFQGPTTVEGSESPQLSPGLPLTSQEHPTLPQKSVLNRAVERTRDLYESNGWTFRPLGEAGEGSAGFPLKPKEQESQQYKPPEQVIPKEAAKPSRRRRKSGFRFGPGIDLSPYTPEEAGEIRRGVSEWEILSRRIKERSHPSDLEGEQNTSDK